MTGELKLGKLPAREDAYKFKLRKFLTRALSPAPAVFGHTDLVPEYGMLGNDQYGDCVWAGAAHETMTWTAESSRPVAFSTQGVLQDYSAATGFRTDDPNTDRGTDMEAAAKYRRKIGVADSLSQRHIIDAYLELPGVSARGQNSSLLPTTIADVAYHFGGVGIGIEFPASAMDQFNTGRPWSVVRGSEVQGGHYVPLVGRRANGNFIVITWGKLQEVTPLFLTTYVDEAVVYISIERMKNGKTLEGFDVASLQADLAALGGVSPTPAPSPVISDPNVDILDKWAAAKHVGSNATAAKAWLAYKSTHNI